MIVIYIYQKKEQTIFPIVSSVNNLLIIFDKVINHKIVNIKLYNQ
jgi:hypothetical protein